MLNLKKLRVVHTSSIISEKIQVECKDSDVLAIVLKDCHLLEAALATDSRIASLDEKARHHCAELAVAIEEMRAIIWVNPDVPEEGAIEWLEQGAPAEKRRRLRGA
ncbi:MAG TPA: hypothetical protein VK395_33850 [Gemmataceae bacterium]|nr:hypothetical protein [Gemmataceae bacterium]